MSTIDSYFATVRQIATKRGATYNHGISWASADSTRNGERVVVEVSFYQDADAPYYVGEVYECLDDPLGRDSIEHVDAFTGTDASELYRKMGAWV